MKNTNLGFILFVWPQVQLDDADASLEGVDDRFFTAVATELISGQIRIMAGVDEIMRRRQSHIMMQLQNRTEITPLGKLTDKSILHFNFFIQHDIGQLIHFCLSFSIMHATH